MCCSVCVLSECVCVSVTLGFFFLLLSFCCCNTSSVRLRVGSRVPLTDVTDRRWRTSCPALLPASNLRLDLLSVRQVYIKGSERLHLCSTSQCKPHRLHTGSCVTRSTRRSGIARGVRTFHTNKHQDSLTHTLTHTQNKQSQAHVTRF